MENTATKNLTEGFPAKLILTFTLPLFVGNLVQQLYAFVDTWIVGRFLGVEKLAAVGCTGSLMFLVMGLTMGTSMGLSIYLGQKFGAKDFDAVRRSSAACFVLAILISLVLASVGSFFVHDLLVLMQTPPEILENAYKFISIIYCGIPLLMFFMLQTNLLRALGDSKTSTYFLIIGLVLNIIFEPLFLLVFELDVPGAALATVCSQLVINLICLGYIRKKVPILCFRREDLNLSREELINHLKIALPMGFQTALVAIGAIIFQGSLNSLGSLAVAAYAAAQKIDAIAVMPCMSFGMAMAAYVAQNYGARKMDRVWEGVKQCFFMTESFAIIIGAFILFFGSFLMEFFVGPEETQVIEYGKIYLGITGLSYWLLSLLFLLRYTLQGLGQSKAPTLAGLLELLFRSIGGFFLIRYWNFFGGCLVSPCSWFISCLPMAIAYYLLRKQMRV